jgi:hypothetical protein
MPRNICLSDKIKIQPHTLAPRALIKRPSVPTTYSETSSSLESLAWILDSDANFEWDRREFVQDYAVTLVRVWCVCGVKGTTSEIGIWECFMVRLSVCGLGTGVNVGRVGNGIWVSFSHQKGNCSVHSNFSQTTLISFGKVILSHDRVIVPYLSVLSSYIDLIWSRRQQHRNDRFQEDWSVKCLQICLTS